MAITITITAAMQAQLNRVSLLFRKIKLGDILKAINDDCAVFDTTVSGNTTKVTALEAFLKNNVQCGLLETTPTTPSVHADGGAFDFNVNLAAGLVVVNGVLKEFTAQADFDVANGAASPVDGANTDIIYTIVAKEAAGVVSLQAVAGAAAAAGAVVAPTTAQINTAVTHTRWVVICTVQLHRTGAATITQTHNNAVRPVLV